MTFSNLHIEREENGLKCVFTFMLELMGGVHVVEKEKGVWFVIERTVTVPRVSSEFHYDSVQRAYTSVDI